MDDSHRPSVPRSRAPEVRDPHRAHGGSARRDAQAVEVRRRQGLRLVLGVRSLSGIAPPRWRHELLRGDRDPDRGRHGHAAHSTGQRRLLRRVPQSRAARQVAHHHRPSVERPRRLRARRRLARRRGEGLRLRLSVHGPREDMLEEYAQIMRLLLDPEQPRASFEGKHFRVADAPNNPTPLQPRIPIWTGGAARSARSGRPRDTPTDGMGPTSARTTGSTRARSSTSGARRRGATRRRSCAL